MRVRTAVAITALFLLQHGPALAVPGLKPPSPPTRDKPAEEMTAEQFSRQTMDSVQAYEAGEFQRAYDLIKPLVDTPIGRALPDKPRAGLYFMLAASAWSVKSYPEAYEASKQATALDGTVGRYWLTRVYLAGHEKQAKDAIDGIALLARQEPALLGEMDIDEVRAFYALTIGQTDAPALRFSLLESLYASKWKPSDPLEDPFWFWTDYATLLADKGLNTRAAMVAQRVSDPSEIVKMRVDRRFASVVQQDPGRFDPMAAAKADLAKARAEVAAYPDRLRAVIHLARALLALNQSAEALAVLDAATAKAKAPAKPGAEPAFKDIDDELSWTLNLRSIVLMRLGREEEGLAVLREGAAQKEDGELNTSQVLNLAGVYNDLGRPKEALETVAKVGAMSEFGKAVRLQAEACAYAQLGDDKAMRTRIEDLRKLTVFNPGALETALLCANDLDAVAKIWLERVKDPEKRAGLLYKVQDFPKRAHRGVYEIEIDRRFDLVKARPEVRAAILRYGSIETVDLYPVY